MTSESLQNFYQDYRNRACPPKSHNFIEILPDFISIDTFLDLVVIETDCGDCVLFEGAVCDGLYESGFSGILQSDDGYFELLVEESGFNPGEDFIDEGEHRLILIFLYWTNKTYNYKSTQIIKFVDLLISSNQSMW